MGWRPGNAGTAAAVAQLVPFQLDPARGSAQRACDWLWGGLVPFQLVSPKNACPRPWTERNLYPDRSPFGDRFGFVRPLLNFCVVRAKRLAQIVGTALEDALGALKSVFFALVPKLTDCSGCWDRPRDASSASADPDRPMDYRRLARRAVAARPDRLAAAAARCACAA